MTDVRYDPATLLALADELDAEAAHRTLREPRIGRGQNPYRSPLVRRLEALAKSYRKRAASAKEAT